MRKSATPPVFLVVKLRRKAARRKRRQLRRKERARRRHARHMLKLAGASGAPAIELQAPEFFALGRPESHRRLTLFLRQLCDLTLNSGRVVCIDFRPTVKFFSDGTLLFFAELQRILLRKPDSVKCLPPKDPVARQVLAHLGLLRQMGRGRPIPSDRDDVTHWNVLSGVEADATKGLGEAIANLPRLPRPQIRKLFRSVSEALTNVTQHAYIEARRDGTGLDSERGWWMFVREEPDELVVVFCDLGVGVPYTVPNFEKHAGWLQNRLKSILRAVGVHAHQEGEIIQATVEEKRSRFFEEHRGNGFANMVEGISAAGQGRLQIISNRGAYTLELHNGREEHHAYNYAESIFGTVIGWHITLPEKTA